jgi:hypothetical protein
MYKRSFIAAASLGGALLLGFGTLAAQAQTTAAVVEVKFSNPERFADAGETSKDREANLDELAKHLQKLGKRILPPGEKLAIDVTEVDLAGRVPPSAKLTSPRVLRDRADWPRIKLSYVRTNAAGATSRGDESLSDQNYMSPPLRDTGDPLRYEKRMLTNWFEQRFSKAATASQ